jgi:uncharacterized phage protein (TIGR01671 family)
MSREIKFAFWHKRKKEMWHVESIDWRTKEVSNGGDVASLDDGDLLQFTGLLDKNGKEIFKGNLLQYDGDNFKLINKEKIYQVKYDDNLAQYYSYNLENSFDTFLVVRAWKESKIIGNIYENSELIGGQDE